MDAPSGLNESNSTRPLSGCTLTFDNISVKVDQRWILNKVNGFAKPGEVLAIIGPSGAGKTTLLNCLAGRLSIDSGQILMNSKTINKELRRKISYVLQHEIFLSNLTCWQTIWYTAQLRLPGSMPLDVKRKRVDEIIDALDLRKCLHTVMGSDMVRGLSGGERKRTSIACELLTNPYLMVLDEPTSGLDSSTAYSLCATLKKYAKISGKTVILTIHQPSSQIFNMFDQLLLLCDGERAFYGSVPQCAQHFIDLGLPCPPNYNLADHILDQVGQPGSKAVVLEGVQRDWYEESSDVEGTENQSMQQLARCNEMEVDENDDIIKYQKEYTSKWPTSFFLQYLTLLKRHGRQAVPEILSKWYFLQLACLSAFVGFLWFQLEPTEERLKDRLSVSYFTALHTGFTIILRSISSFPAERETIMKERLAGYYRLSSYYLAKMSVELPMFAVIPALFTTVMFWVPGLSFDVQVYFQYLFAVLLYTSTCVAVGQFFSILLPRMTSIFLAVNTVTLVGAVAAGFFVRNMPFWISWIKYFSLMRYAANSLVAIDLSQASIQCGKVTSGYASCVNVTASDENTTFSHVISKRELLDKFTLQSDGLPHEYSLTILLGVFVCLQSASYLVLRFVRKPKLA